jgi:hypothetical protein
MKTILLIITLALVIFVALIGAEVQPPTKVHRIGRLVGRPPTEPDPFLEAFR